MPFGGVKHRGLGHELSWFRTRAYTNIKRINLYN